MSHTRSCVKRICKIISIKRKKLGMRQGLLRKSYIAGRGHRGENGQGDVAQMRYQFTKPSDAGSKLLSQMNPLAESKSVEFRSVEIQASLDFHGTELA